MTRLLAALTARPADPDADLLGRFAAVRDEAAFAELVRRHGPAVWGVCRRQLANPADAEDAFQAAFLVLARRADAAPACLGAWLHRVAVLTCRNVRRANRRRPSVALPADLPATRTVPALDVDDLLNQLPERDRRAVVLCHLHGFTRPEAAKQLGIPEGTLSARLSRGLAKLRGSAGVLVVAAVPAVPAGLAAGTVRAVGVWGLSATGLSPAATGAATGVLRMFLLKKLTTAAAVVVVGLTVAGVGVGLAGRPVAVAADPPPKADKPPADWNKTAELTGTDGKVAVKLTTRAEKGWLVARCDSPVGQKVWEVVLGQLDGTEPPTMTADQEKATVAVEFGKYFARDSAGCRLRVLRQKKTDGSPAWSAPKPLVDTLVTGQSNTLCFQAGRDWLWVTAGPFGDDTSTRRPDRADLCLRLDHAGQAGGPTGTARITAVRGGVNTINHGDTQATDDGELFVASYRSHRPPAGPKPAPAPATLPLAKPTPPAVDADTLSPEVRKSFDELVPVCVTGTVRDPDGHPIAGAEVGKHHTVGYAATFGQTRFDGHARTDAAGRYALWFRTQPGTTVVLRGLNAAADGYVAHSEDFQFDQVKAHPDQPGEWDFVLARGELLAGTVPAAVGVESVELLVRGPSFTRTELLDNGKFRLWVPPGRYTLTAVLAEQRVARDGKLAGSEYSHGRVIAKAAELRDVPGGRGDVVVK